MSWRRHPARMKATFAPRTGTAGCLVDATAAAFADGAIRVVGVRRWPSDREEHLFSVEVLEPLGWKSQTIVLPPPEPIQIAPAASSSVPVSTI